MGLMGSGKSTLGVPLARRLGRRYVDNDRQVSVRTGVSAPELATTDGVEALHRAEADELAAALADPEPAVIAAAASTITDRAIREELQHHFAVWVDPPIDELAAHFDRTTRRDIGADAAEFLARQRAERAPLYQAVSRMVVHPDAETGPDALVAEIATAVEADETGNQLRTQ
jgi:shikimate kinase